MVISRLDYCNSLLASLPACVIQPPQLIHNAAAHLVFSVPEFSHVTPLLRSLRWLPVAARIRFKVLTLVYAAANKTAPHYLQDIIQAYTPARPLRSATTGRLAHPSGRATVFRSSRLQSFSTLAPQWWNDLPNPHKNCSLPAHLPPQLEDSPLHSVPRLLFASFLIYCPFSITVPCIVVSTTIVVVCIVV